MFESSRNSSCSIPCAESGASKALNPGTTGGLPLHNNPTLLFNQPTLFVQPSLSQGCKSNSLPSTPCVTPVKSDCGTKSDTLTGLSANKSLVGNCEKPVAAEKACGSKSSGCGTTATPIPSKTPVAPVMPSSPLPKVELERKDSGCGSNHNCSDNKLPQNQPVSPAQPTTPTQPVPAPVAQPVTPDATVVVTGSGYGTIAY